MDTGSAVENPSTLKPTFVKVSYAMSEQNPNDVRPVSQSGWFGPFYYNRQDRRVIVHKRWGYGYTFNFARPATYAIILAVLLLPVPVLLLAL